MDRGEGAENARASHELPAAQSNEHEDASVFSSTALDEATTRRCVYRVLVTMRATMLSGDRRGRGGGGEGKGNGTDTSTDLRHSVQTRFYMLI